MDGCSTVTPRTSSRRSVNDARLHAERVQRRREGETGGPRADDQDVGGCGHHGHSALLDLDTPLPTPGGRCLHALAVFSFSKGTSRPHRAEQARYKLSAFLLRECELR
jgi:hypothetical protein